jgi:hypothetical protein
VRHNKNRLRSMRSLWIENEPIQATNTMSSQQPTMILNVKNGMTTGGLSCGGKSVKPISFAVKLMLPIRLPKKVRRIEWVGDDPALGMRCSAQLNFCGFCVRRDVRHDDL